MENSLEVGGWERLSHVLRSQGVANVDTHENQCICGKSGILLNRQIKLMNYNQGRYYVHLENSF